MADNITVNVQVDDDVAVEVAVELPIVQVNSIPCLPVSILNQSFVEIASVPSGGSYNVVELVELVDDEALNTSTVIDTI